VLIPIPPELKGMVRFVPGGCALKESATPGQQEAFKTFQAERARAQEATVVSA